MNTGWWCQKAINEASKYCNVHEVTNNSALGKKSIADPSEWTVDPNAKYFHYCDNETIEGVEFPEFPFDKVPEGMPIVADMSSNILTRPLDWSKLGVVYSGASKNIGPAGVTFVVVRNDLIPGHRSDTPLLCDWETYSKAQNTFHNTPSCWAIYMSGLNLAHMIEQGGVEAMAAKAAELSSKFYEVLDSSDGYYINLVDKKYRSRINIPFRVCDNEELEDKFNREAHEAGLVDTNGHGLQKGSRVSFYNAMPREGVEALIQFMAAFKANNPKPTDSQ